MELGCTTKCSKDADCEKENGKPDCIGSYHSKKTVKTSLLSEFHNGGCSVKLNSGIDCHANADCASNFCKNLYYSKFNGVYLSDLRAGYCADSRGSAEDPCLTDNDCEKGLSVTGHAGKREIYCTDT